MIASHPSKKGLEGLMEGCKNRLSGMFVGSAGVRRKRMTI